MAGATEYLRNKLLDAWAGGGYTKPASLYFGLLDAAGTELSGGGYARKGVTNNATNFPAASGAEKKNAGIIAFAVATGDWAEAVYLATFDTLSGGNKLTQDELDDPVTIYSGEAAQFDANALTITCPEAA